MLWNVDPKTLNLDPDPTFLPTWIRIQFRNPDTWLCDYDQNKIKNKKLVLGEQNLKNLPL